MAETLARLSGPSALASGTSTMFTGTASHLYVIRSMRFLNQSTSPVTLKVGIGGVADANLIIPPIALAAGEAYHDSGLFVLSGAETLQANTTGTGITATICGLDDAP